jgi:PAS domain S-box-containing protein
MSFMVDASGMVLSVDAFGASQLGYAASELRGQSVLNLVVEEDKEFVRRKMSLCLETPGRSNSWEVRKRRKDRTMLWIRENARAMLWSRNQLIMLIACEDISERVWGAMESAQLAAIVSSSADAIVSKTLDGTITSWNAGATNILGYQADEMLGQPFTRIIPPELHQEEKQILMRLHRGERIQHYETIRLAKGGRRVDISLTISPLFSQSGKVVGASKIARDITERKLAEQALREIAARLRTLTETAVDGVILIDARGVVMVSNPACEKLFGYSADTLIGQNVKRRAEWYAGISTRFRVRTGRDRPGPALRGLLHHQGPRHGNRARGQSNDHPGSRRAVVGRAKLAPGSHIPLHAAG